MNNISSSKREAIIAPEFTRENPRRSKRLKSSPIAIRLMKANEIDQVLQMNLEGLLDYCNNDAQRKATIEYHDSHKERNIKKMKTDCDEEYKRFNRRVWVVVSGTKILGSMELKPRPRKAHKDRSGVQLDNVCVIPEHQGTGIAQKLLLKVEAHCRKEKIGAIHLTTQDNLTRAIRFYEKEGYRFTHEKNWDGYKCCYYVKDL